MFGNSTENSCPSWSQILLTTSGWHPQEKFSPRIVFSRQPIAPCSHHIARYATILCHLSQPLCVLTHLFWLYVWGGPSNPEGMAFHYVIGYFCLLIMDKFGHRLVGGFGRKNGLALCSCPLVQTPTWWLVFNHSLVGTPLVATTFRSGTTWEIPILVAWSRFMTLHTSLPSAHHNPFSHISHPGAQGVSFPLPLSTFWVRPGTMP